jgi:hypothetical protein
VGDQGTNPEKTPNPALHQRHPDVGNSGKYSDFHGSGVNRHFMCVSTKWIIAEKDKKSPQFKPGIVNLVIIVFLRSDPG